MNTLLFIDLEDTLITTWDDPWIGQKNKVEELLREHFNHNGSQMLDAVVWSFAVWNDDDRNKFHVMMEKWLSDTFKLRFTQVVTVEEMCKNTCKFTGLALDRMDFMQIFGKDASLIHWACEHFSNQSEPTKIVLLDDCVENQTIHFPDRDLTIQFLRV